jgi:hypothetical protein
MPSGGDRRTKRQEKEEKKQKVTRSIQDAASVRLEGDGAIPHCKHRQVAE